MGRGTIHRRVDGGGVTRAGQVTPPPCCAWFPSPAFGQGGIMAYDALPDAELAAVVTYLEMRAPPGRDVPASSLSLSRIEKPDPDRYRALFRRVGAPWLWF